MKEKKLPTTLIATVTIVALLAVPMMAIDLGKKLLSPHLLNKNVTYAVYNDKINNALGVYNTGLYNVSLSQAWDADQQGISLRTFDGCYDSSLNRKLDTICFDVIKVTHSGLGSGYLSKETLATLDSDFKIELDAIFVKRSIMKAKSDIKDLKNDTQDTNQIRMASKAAKIDRFKLISDISTFVAFKHMKCDTYRTVLYDYVAKYEPFDNSLYGLTSNISCKTGRELIKNHLQNQQQSRMKINIINDLSSDSL